MKFFALILCLLVLISSTMAHKKDVCKLKHSQDGVNEIKCRAEIPSWSYNADTKECVLFSYGGCHGNANRFESLEKCEKMCKK